MKPLHHFFKRSFLPLYPLKITLCSVRVEHRHLFGQQSVNAFEEHFMIATEMSDVLGDRPFAANAAVESAARNRFEQRRQSRELRLHATKDSGGRIHVYSPVLLYYELTTGGRLDICSTRQGQRSSDVP